MNLPKAEPLCNLAAHGPLSTKMLSMVYNGDVDGQQKIPKIGFNEASGVWADRAHHVADPAEVPDKVKHPSRCHGLCNACGGDKVAFCNRLMTSKRWGLPFSIGYRGYRPHCHIVIEIGRLSH